LEKIDDPEARVRLEDLRAKRQELEAMLNTPFPTGTYLLLWMTLSVAISMNLLCDYFALGKTRIILKRISATESPIAIGGYLFIDLILAVIIWIVSIAIFLLINTDAFLAWAKETPSLVSVIGIVSLASTVATSIWIYTFLAGGFLSIYLRRFLRFLLRGTTSLISPEKHTFKVIGIVGSVAIVLVVAVSLLVLRLAR